MSETSIKPYAFRYRAPLINPESGILADIKYLVTLPGCIFSWVEVIEMPVFRPNELFWEKFTKPHEERWETYARVMREIIHEGGNIKYAERETAADDKWVLEE